MAITMLIARNKLKRVGVSVVFLFVIGVASFYYFDKPKPEENSSLEADQLAQSILGKYNYDAFKASECLSWTFLNNTYTWLKQKDSVIVSWGEVKVFLDLNTKSGKVFENEVLIDSPELEASAYKRFCNDSFWTFAHYKLFDNGTTRSLVKTDRGKSLLITYSRGGVTPGDSYLWLLDNENSLAAWEMWVGIIPLGGVRAEFENWQQDNGVFYAKKRRTFGYELEVIDFNADVE